MSLFATSISVVQQPGVFPIEQSGPVIIDGISQGNVGIVGQGEWGPVDTTYIPSSVGDMIATYFPPGAPHTSTLYYAMMRRKSVPWAVTRILGGAAGILPPEPTVVVTGTPGSTVYKYLIVARNAAGTTQAGMFVTVTTGNATLTGGNHNDLSWPAVVGATTYDVYRTFTGGTPATVGKISSAQAGTTFNDTGIAGDTTIPPTANTTGYTQAVCYLYDSASATQSNATPGNAVAKLVAKYPGTLPNGAVLTATVATASDGVANHFDLTLTLTNSITGITSESSYGKGLQTVATIILPNAALLAASYLVASYSVIGAPVTTPANAAYNFVGGSNGLAVTAADYNTGLTQLANQDAVRVVVADDCGDTIRAAVNANLQAHADAKTDRVVILQANINDAWTVVKGASGNGVGVYRDDRVIFTTWVYCNDDLGNPQVSPFSSFIASAIINLEPHQSHAWWDPKVTTYYTGVASIYTTLYSTGDDGIRNDATNGGICVPIKLEDGRFAALHDRTTLQQTNKLFATTRRVKDFLAKSIKNGITSWVNGPNIGDQQRSLKLALDKFLDSQVAAGRLIAVAPADIKTPNTAGSMALGQFAINMSGTIPAPMEKIFPIMNFSPTVVVSFA